MPTKIELLQEAYNRGILPDNKKALYEEAVNRGLIKSTAQPEQAQPKLIEGANVTRYEPQEQGNKLNVGIGTQDYLQSLKDSRSKTDTESALLPEGRPETEPFSGKQFTSDIARPVISGLTSAGGAIIGTAGATPGVGTAVGGGIGYAIGEELADHFDEWLGLRDRQPLLVELKESAMDVAEGATYEMGGQLVAAAAAPALRVVSNKISKLALTKEGAKKVAGDLYIAQTNINGKPSTIALKTYDDARDLEALVPGLKFNVGQLTDNPEVIKWQRARISNPGIAAAGDKALIESNTKAINDFMTKAKGKATISDTAGVLQRERTALDTGVAFTEKELEREAARLDTGKGIVETGEEIKGAAREGEKAARKEATKLFEDVPQFEIDASRLNTAIDEISQPYGIAEDTEKNIPTLFGRLKEILKTKGNTLTPDDLQSFNSELKDKLKEAKGMANPNPKKAARLSKMISEVDAVLKEAGEVGGIVKPKVTPTLPKVGKETLKSEASKYKSADEFIKSQESSLKTAETGKPITAKLYHGSPDARFAEEFDPNKAGYFSDAPELFPDNKSYIELYGGINKGFKGESVTGNKGISFTDSKATARSYANKPAYDYQNSVPMVLERYVKLKNPKVYNLGGKKWNLSIEAEMRKALEEGHDGLIFKNILDDYHPSSSNIPSNNIIALDPNAIKTKAELTNIWNKSNKPKPTKTTVPTQARYKGNIIYPEKIKNQISEINKKLKSEPHTTSNEIDVKKTYKGLSDKNVLGIMQNVNESNADYAKRIANQYKIHLKKDAPLVPGKERPAITAMKAKKADMQKSLSESVPVEQWEMEQAAGKLKKAQKFYKKEVIDKYKSGTIGKILKPDAAGDSVGNAQVASRFFKPGRGGVEQADEFINAIGDNKQAKDAMVDYIKQDLLRSATHPVSQQITEQKLKTWLAKYSPALERFGLKTKFNTIKKATEELDSALKLQKEFNKSQASKLLDAEVNKEVQEALKIGSKRTGIRKLIKSVKGDKNAISGIQNALIDHIMYKDVTEQLPRTIAKMNDQYRIYRPAILEAFKDSPEKIRAIDTYRKVMEKFEIGKRSPTSAIGSDTFEKQAMAIAQKFGLSNNMLVNVAKSVASILKINSEKTINMFLDRAAFDPEFAYTLVLIAKGRKPDIIKRRMYGHMMASGTTGIRQELKKE